MERNRTAAALLREDVDLMRVGKLKVMSHGFEVTDEHVRRLEQVLEKLESLESSEGP